MKNVFLTLSIVLLGLWLQPAMAYIDPGSGSAIMSAIIGFFVAAGLVIKTYWYKIKSIFIKKNMSEELNHEKKSEK